MNIEERFEHFTVMIAGAAKAVQRLKHRYMERYDLSAAHTNCLCRLYRSGPAGMNQRALMEAEQMDRAQVSRVLSHLTAKGYVQRLGDGGYRSRYSLTESGTQAAAEILGIIQRVITEVSRELSPSELQTFYATLDTICRGLDRAAGSDHSPEAKGEDK